MDNLSKNTSNLVAEQLKDDFKKLITMLKNTAIKKNMNLRNPLIPIIDKYMYYVLVSKKLKSDIQLNT